MKRLLVMVAAALVRAHVLRTVNLEQEPRAPSQQKRSNETVTSWPKNFPGLGTTDVCRAGRATVGWPFNH